MSTFLSVDNLAIELIERHFEVAGHCLDSYSQVFFDVRQVLQRHVCVYVLSTGSSINANTDQYDHALQRKYHKCIDIVIYIYIYIYCYWC